MRIFSFIFIYYKTYRLQIHEMHVMVYNKKVYIPVFVTIPRRRIAASKETYLFFAWPYFCGDISSAKQANTSYVIVFIFFCFGAPNQHTMFKHLRRYYTYVLPTFSFKFKLQTNKQRERNKFTVKTILPLSLFY